MALQKGLKTLREVRNEKNITQADIFKETNIWIAKISGIENGYFKATDEEKNRIVKVLKVSVKSIDWGKN
jgi:transcriptional regulator with XRE-family HTH domain